MDLNWTHAILAQTPSNQPQPQPADFLRGPLIPMMIMMAGLFYIMHRSQKKKAREHAEMIKSAKPGDKILTSGGVLGVVLTVKEKTLTIRSADTKLEITKSAIAEITERSGATSAD